MCRVPLLINPEQEKQPVSLAKSVHLPIPRANSHYKKLNLLMNLLWILYLYFFCANKKLALRIIVHVQEIKVI